MVIDNFYIAIKFKVLNYIMIYDSRIIYLQHTNNMPAQFICYLLFYIKHQYKYFWYYRPSMIDPFILKCVQFTAHILVSYYPNN